MARAPARLSGLLALAAVAHPLSAQPAHPVPVRVAWAALGVDLHLAEHPFQVRGRTFADAQRDLDRHGPLSDDGARRHAITIYEIETRWGVERTSRVCRIAEVTVTADILIRLPRWPGARDAPEKDFNAWQTLERELTAHEYTHRDLALAAAYRLARKLKKLEAPSCPALGHRAAAVTARVRDELRRAQEAVDAPAPPSR